MITLDKKTRDALIEKVALNLQMFHATSLAHIMKVAQTADLENDKKPSLAEIANMHDKVTRGFDAIALSTADEVVGLVEKIYKLTEIIEDISGTNKANHEACKEAEKDLRGKDPQGTA